MNSNIKNRAIIFFAVCFIAALFLFPTVNSAFRSLTGQGVAGEDSLAKKWFSKPISLGLDLSGGVHLVYQVIGEEAVTARLQTTASSFRGELRAEKIAVTKARVAPGNLLEVNLLSSRHLEKAKELMIASNRGYELVNEEQVGAGAKLVYKISDLEQVKIKDSAVNQAIETLRARVDQFGVAEPLIQKVGTDRILLQMPGIQDIEAVKKVVGKIAKLEFRLLPSAGATTDSVTLKDREGSPIQVEDMIQMSGESIDNATVGFDPNGRVEVLLSLNSDGAKNFANITGSNVGRNLAIVLDGVVYSSPTINERIAGGRCSITGAFQIEEAKELALVLRAGALPAPLKVLEERTVGPSLGADSIRSGVIAILVGFIAILIFMVVYYKKSGFVASVILLVNLFLILAALAAFGATLTLPGLAGLALTIGMAVDANIISFERIKDEMRNGADRDASVNEGFAKALSAILDSNFTTLLAGVILFYFGTGPIRGFAVTLSIGVLSTVFCATFVAQLAFDYFSLRNKKGLSI